MFLLRILVFTILVCLLAILAYPLAVIFDISQGGTGYGLCQDLILCKVGFTKGPVLFIQLVSIIFFLVGSLRLSMYFQKYLNEQ